LRAPWIWRQKQAQTPSTRESSMRCQPMCGRLNLRDFETAVGGGWAAFTRRGSGDSHEARSSTGIRCMFGTSVRTYQGVIFAQTSVFVACCYHFVRMPISWCNPAVARHDSRQPRAGPPARPAAGGGHSAGTRHRAHRSAWRGRPHRHPISLPAGRRRDTRVGSPPHTLGVTSSQFPSGSATLPDPTPV
jgi:hypothetical protein